MCIRDRCTILPNFSKMGQSAAELLWFSHFQVERRPPSWIWSEVDFNHYTAFADLCCTNVPDFSTSGQLTDDLQWLIDLAQSIFQGLRGPSSGWTSDLHRLNCTKCGDDISKSSALHKLVLDFIYVSPFRNERHSLVENWDQILHVFTPPLLKYRGEMGELNKFNFFVPMQIADLDSIIISYILLTVRVLIGLWGSKKRKKRLR